MQQFNALQANEFLFLFLKKNKYINNTSFSTLVICRHKKIQNSTVIRYLANELAGAPKISTNGQSGYEANTVKLTAFFVGNVKRLLT